MTGTEEGAGEAEGARDYSLWQLTRYFLKLGSIGFGGPVALVGYMRRDLVDRRRWVSRSEYDVGLALAQLAPGPLAAQLGFYLGFLDYRVVGATLVGLAFVLPSFVMVVAAGVAYVHYGGLPWIQAVFYGVGAAVIGIIAYHAYRLTANTISRDWLLWVIHLVIAGVTVVTESERVELFLGAGILVWLVRAPPRGAWRRIRARLPSVLAWPMGMALAQAAPAGSTSFLTIAAFFAKAGAFVFGSGLAIVPFLYAGVVQEHGWLTDEQFIDAVAIALITPGPVVITTGFIGYLVRGFPGAVVAAVATFLPAYLLTIFPAPYFKKYGSRPAIAAFVKGITAAAIGAISGAVVVLGRRSVVDLPSALVAAAALGALLAGRGKVPEPAVVLVAAAIGLVVYPLVG